MVTPDASVFSLIVSTLKVPSNLTLPVSPNISIVCTELPFFTSKSLKLPCLEAEIKLVEPTA